MHRYITLIIVLASSTTVWAQFGGQSSYEFLNIPSHARLAALGGVNVSHANEDVNFFFSNPALVGDSLSGWGSASYLFHVADVGQASFAYTDTFGKIGTISVGIQHVNYGSLDGFDATGAVTGTFRSGETAIVISKSHQVSFFRLGANLKAVFSNLAGFHSSALMLDLGGVFIHPDQDLRVGLAIKNIGIVLSEYSQTSSSTVPVDVQAGVTYKPEYMPLRFSCTAYNLVHLGKLYDDPDDEESPATLDKVMAHFNFGAEILLHRNVHVLAGYNFLRQKELKVETGGGGSGFTFGLAAKINAINLVFSHSRYAVGNANYTFTLSANIERMILKRKRV